jgi:signal transduction histidine kinase/CheY-like chemotaxis protein
MSTDTVAAVGHCEQIEDASNMAPGRPSSALNNPIFPLQVQVLYKRAPAAISSLGVMVPILVWVLWPSVDHARLLLWAGALGLITVGRVAIWRLYRPTANDYATTRRALRLHVAGVAASALGLGSSALLLYVPDRFDAQLLVTLVVGGACAGAVASCSSYIPALYIYVAAALGPLVLRLALHGGSQQLSVGLLAMIYAAALLSFARSGHRAFTESARLRFHNIALVNELQAARDRLAQTNERLEERVRGRTAALHEAYRTLVRQLEERQRLQDRLLESQKMEVIGQLTGGIAHDFNNLLSVITSYATFMREALPGDDPLQEDVAMIDQASQRAAWLTGQLLSFSRRQVRQVRVLDLNATLSNMDKILRRLIGAHISLVTKPDHTIGAIEADASQVEQVVMNLALNARDAMPRGGTLTMQTGTVEIAPSEERRPHGIPPGAYVVLTVRDTGSGMDRETQAHIFEPFFTTKGAKRGTGLGLATVHTIIAQSHGHITVESEVDCGTTFRVYLPRVETVRLASDIHHQVSGSLQGDETVLVVEDHDEVRKTISRALQSSGYQVLPAARGEEAVDICAAHEAEIHLLLTDLMLPGPNGVQLAELLTEQRPSLRVLYMSGHVDDESISIEELGQRPFIAKPFAPRDLLLRVRETLDELPLTATPQKE